MLSICSSVHESSVTDLTREMCVPMRRCTPAQRRQMKLPMFHDAQRGPFSGQSAHTLFSGCLSRSIRMAWWRASVFFLSSAILTLQGE